MAITRKTIKTAGTKRSRSTSCSQISPKVAKTGSHIRSRTTEESKQHSSAITFGLEFEFVLAFHEHELKSVCEKYGIKANIVKRIEYARHKDFLETTNIQTNLSHDRTLYPSWALSVPLSDYASICDTKGANFSDLANTSLKTRRYVMEPLLVARKVLEESKVPVDVVGWIEPSRQDPRAGLLAHAPDDILIRHDKTNHERWTLTNDYTLIGALRSQLEDKLRARGTHEDAELPKWDSYGIELISPIFQLATIGSAFIEIDRYLSAFKNGKTWDAMESVWASTHVHIGFDIRDKDDMPMLLLQHVAYILILHEDLISRCHPKGRCGVKPPDPRSLPDPDTEEEAFPEEDVLPENDMTTAFDWTSGEYPPSNIGPDYPSAQELAENDQHVLAAEAAYTGYGSVDSNLHYLTQQLLPSYSSPPHTSHELHTLIRNAIFNPSGNILDLVRLLQRPSCNSTGANDAPHRGYMVNWCNLWNLHVGATSWKSIKPTIEFRQHACSFDVGEVRHWVVFLESVVRIAEGMAEMTVSDAEAGKGEWSFAEREGLKYTDINIGGVMWPCESIGAFCRFLELDDVEAAYWKGRYEKFKDDRPSGSGK